MEETIYGPNFKYFKYFMYFLLLPFSGCLIVIATKSPYGYYEGGVNTDGYFLCIEIKKEELCQMWADDYNYIVDDSKKCFTISEIKENSVEFSGKMYDRYVVDNHFDFIVTGNWFEYTTLREITRNMRGKESARGLWYAKRNGEINFEDY